MKYLITWNAGYGQSEDIVDAARQADADKDAYQQWLQEAESQAEYEAQPLTAELAEEYGLDFEEDET